MRNVKSPLFACGILLTNAAAFSSLYAIFALVQTGEYIVPGLPVWMAFMVICPIGLSLLLKREREEHTVILFCVGAFAAQCIVTFALYGAFTSLLGVLIAICLWCCTYFRCYAFVRTPPTTEQVMGAFEQGVVVLLVCLFFYGVKELSLTKVIPLVGAVICNLLVLVLRRTAGSREGGGAALRSGGVMLAFVGMFALAAAVFYQWTAPVKQGASAIWRGVRSAGLWLFDLVERFMNFLVSLLPQKDLELTPPDMEPGLGLSGAEEGETLFMDGEAFVFVIVGAILLVIMAVVVFHLIRGGQRIGRKKLGGERGTARRSMGRVSLFSRLRDGLRYGINCVVKFRTAPGLFAQLERRSGRRRNGRRADESCREFLRRVAPDYPGGEAALERLGDALDARYFGGKDPLSPREVDGLRKTLRSAKKKQGIAAKL